MTTTTGAYARFSIDYVWLRCA